jgi:hypothetical protein
MWHPDAVQSVPFGWVAPRLAVPCPTRNPYMTAFGISGISAGFPSTSQNINVVPMPVVAL